MSIVEPRLGPPGPRSHAAVQTELRPAPVPDQAKAERATPAEEAHAVEAQRQRRGSSLTRRILTLNILALVIPVVGLLYLDQYRDSLVETELQALRTEGELFAAALGETGVVA